MKVFEAYYFSIMIYLSKYVEFDNKKIMDNNIRQQMEKWKKDVMMDPVLNSLMDGSVSGEELLTDKILTLPHEQIVKVYTRLAALKHVFSRSIQREVDIHHQLIYEAFQEAQSYRQDISSPNTPSIQENLNHLKKFNNKYKTVQNSLTLWKNTLNVLHFSEAFQSILVQCRIVRTLMRGYDAQQARDESINSLKISKLICEITQNCTRYDFTGIAAFENQRVFLNSTKSIIFGIAEKNIQKYLGEVCQNPDFRNNEKQMVEMIEVLINIGGLREFITAYFKKGLSEVSQKVKKTFQHQEREAVKESLEGVLIPTIMRQSFGLIYLEELLASYKHMEIINNIPNLFSRYWDKLVEYYSEILGWVRDQQNRNPPKIDDQALPFKYPVIYRFTAATCDRIHRFILQSTVFHPYNFLKSKEKLMFTLLQISKQYYKKTFQIIKQNIQALVPENFHDHFLFFENFLRNCQHQYIFQNVVENICKQAQKSQQKEKILKRMKEIIIESQFGISLEILEHFKVKS